jgi:hypothetical protein
MKKFHNESKNKKMRAEINKMNFEKKKMDTK